MLKSLKRKRTPCPLQDHSLETIYQIKDVNVNELKKKSISNSYTNKRLSLLFVLQSTYFSLYDCVIGEIITHCLEDEKDYVLAK